MRLQLEVCLIALLFASAEVKAQGQRSPIQRGSIQIGGTADISRTKASEGGSGLTIAEAFPRLGYFVVRGLAVSANLRFRKVPPAVSVRLGASSLQQGHYPHRR